MRKTTLIAGAVAGGLLALTVGAASAQDQELPPGPNRALVYGKCRTCHDLQYLVESAGVPRSTWNDLLDSMKQYGLELAQGRARQDPRISRHLSRPQSAQGDGRRRAGRRAAAAVDGAKVFQEQCSACHQPNGQGVAGQFPPLAGNTDLFLSETYPAMVVLGGLTGKIDVEGKTFNAVMPPLNYLSDAEVAAAVNYRARRLGQRQAAARRHQAARRRRGGGGAPAEDSRRAGLRPPPAAQGGGEEVTLSVLRATSPDSQGPARGRPCSVSPRCRTPPGTALLGQNR